MILITGGGTGGHLKIAQILKNGLKSRGLKAIFIGSTLGQDKLWFEDDEGFAATYFLDSKQVMNKRVLAKVASLAQVCKLVPAVLQIFKQHDVQKVIAVGGYSSAPAVLASIISRKQLFLHEQNAILGKVNQVAKPFAKALFSSFDAASPIKDPLVDEFFLEHFRLRKSLKTIIFLGGSLGATAINDLALNLAFSLQQQNIKIIHQTGKNDFQRVSDFYAQAGIGADCFDFDLDLKHKIVQADFAISRAGSSTMFELLANGVPTLFVPYAKAAKNHQYYNALHFQRQGLCFLESESKLYLKQVQHYLSSDIGQISLQLQGLFKTNASDLILDYILND